MINVNLHKNLQIEGKSYRKEGNKSKTINQKCLKKQTSSTYNLLVTYDPFWD